MFSILLFFIDIIIIIKYLLKTVVIFVCLIYQYSPYRSINYGVIELHPWRRWGPNIWTPRLWHI